MINETLTDEAILAFLVERGFLAVATQVIVTKYAERWACSQYAALIESNVVSEGELADALAILAQAPRLHGISSQHIAPEVLGLLPFEVARKTAAIPIAVFEDTGKVEVAVANPADSAAIEEIRRSIRREIVLAVGERSDIVSAVDEFYPLKDRWPSMWDCVKSQ